MKSLKFKHYLLITILFFTSSTIAAGGKQRPPAKANVEMNQQSETSILSWFNSALFRF